MIEIGKIYALHGRFETPIIVLGDVTRTYCLENGALSSGNSVYQILILSQDHFFGMTFNAFDYEIKDYE